MAYKDTMLMANRPTALLNKIERRLHLKLLDLPEAINKDVWFNEVICEDSIPTFSRYLPYRITTIIDQSCSKDDFFFIDKDVPEGSIILGVEDVDWQSYRNLNGYDRYNFISTYGADEIALTQVSADYVSLFNLGIFPEFLPPNKIRLETCNGNICNKFYNFPLQVLIQHTPNLMTISPTQMGIFEDLCTSDVADFLWGQLKYYDENDTTFLTVSLRIDKLIEWANKKENIMDELKNAYVSTANEYQPIMITI